MTPLVTILASACALLSLALIGESLTLLRARPRQVNRSWRYSRRRYFRLPLPLAATMPLRGIRQAPPACKGWLQHEAEIRAALALDVSRLLDSSQRDVYASLLGRRAWT